uniref:Cadherin domain-containing protein n=1 Tax=Rhabditophanes sp. KR3021 TaxID=114890 RepID=A0AC35TXY0_9BILA
MPAQLNEETGIVLLKCRTTIYLVEWYALRPYDNILPHRQAKSEIVVRMDGSKSIFMLQPRFEQAIYQIKLNENTRPGRVGMVRAHHRAEEVIDDKIIYSLLTDSNQASNFQIDGNSGEINSTLQFDFEKDKRFQFKVIACLLSKPGLCGETDVIISVMDLNDNAPVFNNSLYTITTPLDLSVGSEVGTVVAMDEDSGKNKLIGYSLILPQQDRHLFSIDNNTGTIYLEQSFKEIQNYRFEVEATDHGEPPLSSKATVVVELGGSNPTAPEFDEFRYDIHRQAPIPSGVVLVQVHATDPDPGPIGQVKYQFASPANDGVKKDLEKLSINEESGKISSIVQLTSLDGPIMQITVEAVDQSPVFKRKSQTVVVLHIVSNETDKLEFVPLPKIVFISSDKAPGSSIINVQARSTMSELIKYSLESDSRIKKYFEIEEDRLQLRSKLMPGEYILKLKASIRNDYLTASHQMKVVVMKDREKFPVFDKLAYQFHVPLNGEMPLKLPKVNCTLANSPIEYSMFPTVNFPQGLDIDKITGQLSVDETFVKNNHKKGFVFVVVRARNMDFPQFFSDAAITIKVDETMFPSLLYRFSIDENTAIGSVINTSIKVTQDPSSQDTVRYTIQPSDTFNIDDNGNLIVIKDIDLEQMKPESNGIINLIATAKMNDETTSTKVQIKINDVDEFGPEFVDHNIRFVIKDDMEVGTELGQVMMSDRDFSGLTTLVFKFLTNGQEVFVGIDKEGKVELIDLPATIESGVYDLPLIRSSNHTTLQPVIYEMEPITWSIPGGSNFAGTKLLITMPIHENDPIDWSFNIVSGNEDRLFRLNRFNASTTELELTTNDVRQNVFEIQVNGTNKANDVESMLLNVTIDFTNALQQFLPQFNDKTVDPNINIPLDHPETVSIYSGAASVPSNPSIPILYTIAFNGTQKMFTVDQKGNVNIVIAVEDRKLGNYQVKITAICGTFKADKVINVIINESPTPTQQPQLDVTTTLPPFGRLEFTKPNFAFHAEDTIDTDDIIGKVDFSVTFFNRDDYKIIIVPKVFNQLFKVDMDTGALFVRKSPPNGWKVREIVFQMFIVKNGENVRDAPSTRVNIVIDSSVSSTTIQTPLSTTIQPVTSTTTASHQIDSTPTTVDVLSSLGTTTISITSTTTTAPDVPLITKFFLSPSYTGVVYEGKYVVASLIPLKPSTFKSEDIKDKEKVNFEILPFPSNTSIFIRKESGDIMVIGNVDKQTQNNVITFTVRASNNQNKSNFEDALVSLTILKKVNDNSPLFDENTPTAIAVDINTVPLQIIGQFKATDKEDAIITYSITDFGKDLFGIDDEGNVSIKKSLQSADKVNLIQITASDNGSPPLRTTWPVRVEVFDRNTEVTPVFIPQNYSISVPPNNPIDSSLYQMVPGLGTYSFSITSLPKSDLFRVDNTGKIFLNRYPKSDESGKLYIATVKATVPSSGASAVQEIYIQLEKEMDASTALPLLTTTTNTTPTPITTPPPSLQPNCSFDLKVYQNELIENLNVKTKLGTVKTTCQGPTVVPLTFKFVDNDEDLFEIDSDTGDYYAVKGLDFEQKRVHYMTVQFEYKQQLANIRKRQSTNKIIEGYVRNRLKSNQALIVVTVLNANDNPPTFRNLQPTTNNYIFYVDWQAEEKTVIGSVEADDIDENVKVTFALADNQSPIFGIDKNTGSVYLKTSIATSREDMYSLDVNGSDGELVSTAQIIVYKIGPGVNVIALEVNESPQNVDGHLYETQLSKQLDLNVKVIKKQEFVDLNNTAFLNKTLLLVYASDNDMIPVRDDLLKDQITAKMDQLHLGGLEIGAVTTLKSNNLFGLTSWEILLIAICAVLLLLTCFICVCVCYYCKKRKMADKDIKGYMLDSRTEGPRPYNIEVTTRKTAQQILTGPQTQDGNKKYVDVVDTMNGLYGKIDKSNKRGGVDGTDNNQNRNSNQNLNNTLDQKDYTHERDMSYEMYNEPTRTKSSQSDKKLSSSATELKISSHS